MPRKKPWPKKKIGRPTGSTSSSSIEVLAKMRQLIDLITVGDINKETGKYIKISIDDACDEVWVARHQFYYYVNKFPEIKERYEMFKKHRTATISNKAEQNLLKAMAWEGKFNSMEGKDVARLALDILKQVEKNYNPKIEIETTKEIDFSESAEDIIKKIEELKNT